MSASSAEPSALALMERRLLREREARRQAERLLLDKSEELYAAMQDGRSWQQTLQLALWASGDLLWEWEPGRDRFRIQRFHHLAERATMQDGRAADWLERVQPEDREALAQALRDLREGQAEEVDVEYGLLPEAAGAPLIWRRLRGRAVERDDDGRALRCLGTIRDITAQRLSERSLRLLGHAFSSNRDGLAILDGAWKALEANAALRAMLRAPTATTPIALREHIDTSQLDFPRLEREGRIEVETTVSLFTGELLPVELVVSALGGAQGHEQLFLASLRDISERVRSARLLERMSLYDALTGLPNRISLERRLREAMPDPADDTETALLFIDLDGFKTINEGLGYAAGDELLREVTLRLRGWIGQGDYAARWGGDEFCVITRAAAVRERAERLARRLLEVLDEPYDIEGHHLRVTASIGIALAPEHANSAEMLLKYADRAMGRAKHKGRSGLAFHEPEEGDAGLRELELLGALRRDLELGPLRMAAQAKVDLEGRLVGYEALVRWTHETLGPISPSEFIPLAERHGLVQRVGAVTLAESLRFAQQLRRHGHEVEVAINLSPHQLGDTETLQQLLRLCRRYKVPHEQIGLEVTESAVIDDPGKAHDLLMEFRQQGFAIALDDFGVGHSSLSYLRELPLDKVKIDRSFIVDIAEQPSARALLQGIIGLCHSLGFKVVAEGVEREAQAAVLRELGVDEMQGFLFARPVPVDTILEALVRG